MVHKDNTLNTNWKLKSDLNDQEEIIFWFIIGFFFIYNFLLFFSFNYILSTFFVRIVFWFSCFLFLVFNNYKAFCYKPFSGKNYLAAPGQLLAYKLVIQMGDPNCG